MIHLVYANRSNVGDWLASRGIRSLLGERDVAEHLCDEPFVPDTLRRLAAAKPDDLAIIGGGGLLMDYFAPFWRGLLQLDPRPRFCVWGAGICDWKGSCSVLPPDLLAAIADASELTVVRDGRTREAMSALARRSLPEPVPCPSLAALGPAEPAAPGSGVLHVDHFGLTGPAVHEATEAAARALAYRTNRTYARTNNLVRAGDVYDLERVLRLYAQADVVVTSRLHGAILGLAHGCRVLAVAADHKIDAFCALAGLGDWVLDCADLDQLPQQLDRIEEQPQRRGFVAAARQANAEVAVRIGAMVA